MVPKTLLCISEKAHITAYPRSEIKKSTINAQCSRCYYRTLGNRIDNDDMRILAIFDVPDIQNCLEVLRKNRHVVTHASTGGEALSLLQGQAFDLVLCQASFEADDCNAFELLKRIRVTSDVPFICCRAENTILDNKLDNVFIVTLPLLGGQGFIDNETFHSKKFLPSIEKCLANAVGSTCTVAPLYGEKTSKKGLPR